MSRIRACFLALLLPAAALAQGNATAAGLNATACKELPAWGKPLGIALGTVASVGINIGQNLQADGIRTLPEQFRETQPFKSRTWVIGQAVFISFSIINFAALGFAEASVLVPLESIQFVTNVAYSRVVHKATAPPRMLLGVALAVCGTVLSVVFGAKGSSCHSQAQLEWPWRSGVGWWLWCGISVVVGGVCLWLNGVYTRKVKEGQKPWGYEFVGPITFTLSSALLGGSQMIVQSKVFSELLAMLFQGDYGAWVSWLGWVALVLVVACGIIWVVRLTKCLGLYDPLLILPLMVATYILFGGIAGGIYFREFDTLHLGFAGVWGWPLYVGGLVCVIIGLYCIATAGIAMEKAEKARAAAEAAERAAQPNGNDATQRQDSKSAKELWGKLRVAVKFSAAVRSPHRLAQAEVAQYHPVMLIGVAGASFIKRRVSSRVSGAGREASVSGVVFRKAKGTSNTGGVGAEEVMVDVHSLSFRPNGKAPPPPAANNPPAPALDNLHNLGPSWYADDDTTFSAASAV